MLEKFTAKKGRILERLLTPVRDYADASPKGSVDEGIRTLVEEINSTPGFVTTSSCSGRIAVFLEGPSGHRSTTEPSNGGTDEVSDRSSSITMSSAGGKGGGRWIYTSHTPVDLVDLTSTGALSQRLGLSSYSPISFPFPEARPQFVHFKFEPMILHILTSSAENAQNALNAAMAAGFRESGISSVMDSKTRPTPPIVAVRSSGLALDCIIGFLDQTTPASGTNGIQSMVSETYLRTLVQLANERFEINDERKARFREAFLQQTMGVRPSSPEDGRFRRQSFEPAALRKERKRREGLLRREEMLAYAGALDGVNNDSVDDLENADEIGISLLVEEEDQAKVPSQDKKADLYGDDDVS